MTGFGGRAFEFLGQPSKIYSLLSEKFHQVGPFQAPPANTPHSPTKPNPRSPATKPHYTACPQRPIQL